MKHRGKTPAIYASPRRAYLVLPGQTVPMNARFVIAHANLIALAWAFHKSTHGNLDGTREPSLGGMRSYAENAEAVLQRVVDHKIEPVTLSEFQTLRHTLGSSSGTPDLGWRNNFNTDTLEGKDGEDIKALVERGLMEKFAKDYYRATERGAILAGVHPYDAAAAATRRRLGTQQ